MQVLVMGGTQFNGFALVRELVRTGHDVTILNRGKTEAPLPGSVKRLVCDRTDAAAMRETLAGRDFDCIQDISAYRPEDVQQMVDLFRGCTGHYVPASSTVIWPPTLFRSRRGMPSIAASHRTSTASISCCARTSSSESTGRTDFQPRSRRSR